MLAFSSKVSKESSEAPDWQHVGAAGIQATRLTTLSKQVVTEDERKDLLRTTFAFSCGNDRYLGRIDLDNEAIKLKPSDSEKNATSETKTLFASPALGCEYLKLQPTQQSEVQSMASTLDTDTGSHLLAAVDELGVTVVTRVDSSCFDQDVLKPRKRCRQSTCEPDSHTIEDLVIKPEMDQNRHLRESSWAGVSFSPDSNVSKARVAVTHGFGRETLIHDISSESTRAIRRIGHSQCPTSVTFVPGSEFGNNVVACTEWHGLSVWDVRAKSPVAKCLAQCNIKSSFSSPLFAMDVSADSAQSPVIAVGGRARLVTFIDGRTWKTKSSWKSPLKHDIIGIKMSNTGSHCYTIGLDNEFIGYDIEKGQEEQKSGTKLKMQKTDALIPQSVHQGSMLYWNHRTFRSASRWVGFGLMEHQGGHNAIGISQEGMCYVLTHTESAALGSFAPPVVKNVDFAT